MDAGEAISLHFQWKKKFRTALGLRVPLDVAAIAGASCDPLGKWLLKQPRERMCALSALSECVARHAQFQCAAGGVAQANNDKRYLDVYAMLSTDSSYEAYSRALVAALTMLKTGGSR